jgi:hydrogenase nickel incorporation protein HypB
VQAALENARRVSPGIEAMQVSARTGAGLGDWYGWLQARAREARL